MNTTRSPGDGKLFVVPRQPTSLQQSPEDKKELPHLPGNPLILLAVIFVATLAFAGYAALYGSWGRAKDLLLIFLPPLTALMGAAVRSRS